MRPGACLTVRCVFATGEFEADTAPGRVYENIEEVGEVMAHGLDVSTGHLCIGKS